MLAISQNGSGLATALPGGMTTVAIFVALVLLTSGVMVVLMVTIRAAMRGTARPRGRIRSYPVVVRAPRPQPPTRENRARLTAEETEVRLVSCARYHVAPILTPSEIRILPMLERMARDMGEGYRVLPRLSLGAVLHAVDTTGNEAPHSDAQRVIDSRRLDFVIIDRRGVMVAAIDDLGQPHHSRHNMPVHDEVKRTALRKAGLWLIELPPHTDEPQLREMVMRHTGLPIRRAEEVFAFAPRTAA